VLDPQGKCLTSRVKSSRIGPGFYLAHLAAETNTTPNNSETLRQIILKTTFQSVAISQDRKSISNETAIASVDEMNFQPFAPH
jgi:hypothetical protein